MLESMADTEFQFLFKCTNHEIGCFVVSGQYKFMYTY
jgi:uncharacterized protein YegP (UPF0339 family)